MYNYFFFVYMASAMVGFFVVVSITMFFKQNGRLSRTQWNLRAVTVCYLILCILYIIIDYYLLIMVHKSETCMLFRVIDITAWMLTKYFWYIFILETTVFSEETKAKFRKMILTILLPITLVAMFNYGFLMDEYYYVAEDNYRMFAWCVQLLSVCATLTLNVVFLVINKKHCYYLGIRRLVYTMTTLLIINGIWNGFVTLFLITGKVRHFTWYNLSDPTSIIFLAINVLLFLLVVEYYKIEKAKYGLGGKIQFIAEKYGFTNRETEIAEYIYIGLTYAGIADDLNISKHTVKRHIHNIYQKMEVESKVQFVELVDSVEHV